MTTKNNEKIKNLRPIESEAQLGNVMNEDNELLFGCGCGCGSGSGSGCGSGCGCGCGSGSGSGSGSGWGGGMDIDNYEFPRIKEGYLLMDTKSGDGDLSGKNNEGLTYQVSADGSFKCKLAKYAIIIDGEDTVDEKVTRIFGVAYIKVNVNGKNNGRYGTGSTSGEKMVEFSNGHVDVSMSEMPTIPLYKNGDLETFASVSVSVSISADWSEFGEISCRGYISSISL